MDIEGRKENADERLRVLIVRRPDQVTRPSAGATTMPGSKESIDGVAKEVRHKSRDQQQRNRSPPISKTKGIIARMIGQLQMEFVRTIALGIAFAASP